MNGLVEAQDVSLIPWTLKLDYKNWNYREPFPFPLSSLSALLRSPLLTFKHKDEIISSILPEELLDDVPGAFAHAGHIGKSHTPLHSILRHTNHLTHVDNSPSEPPRRLPPLQIPHRPSNPRQKPLHPHRHQQSRHIKFRQRIPRPRLRSHRRRPRLSRRNKRNRRHFQI